MRPREEQKASVEGIAMDKEARLAGTTAEHPEACACGCAADLHPADRKQVRSGLREQFDTTLARAST
jgi:hypothetical protein